MKNFKDKIKSFQKKYEDKILHFTLIYTAVTMFYVENYIVNGLFFLVIVGLIIGKEWVDKEYTGFSFWDIVAGLAGALVGYAVLFIKS